jgi:hypothetical protein
MKKFLLSSLLLHNLGSRSEIVVALACLGFYLEGWLHLQSDRRLHVILLLDAMLKL